MELYINGYGLLSAAGSSDDEHFLQETPNYSTDQLLCKEPNYTEYIPPMQLRRMSKAVRMGIGASKVCLKNAGVEKPDALSVGTAMGCLQDTEVFLSKMIDQEEQMLTPTAFIQSTHNTVAGQIALINGCHGHNLTYVQRGHSFEHAFLNAALYLNEHTSETMLVGGIDELIDASKKIMQRAGVYTTEAVTSEHINAATLDGSIAGEGASFFLVSNKKTSSEAICVRDIYTFLSKSENDAIQKVNDFIHRLPMTKEQIDVVVLGSGGDKKNNQFYTQLANDTFNNICTLSFKHHSGDYGSASGFALGVACHAVKNDISNLCQNNITPKQIKQLIIINNFERYYSCWHLTVG